MRGAEEHQGRQGGMGLGDVDEPGLPLRHSASWRSQPPMIDDRTSIAVAVGGVSAHTSSAATAASRRWNDWYVVGR